MNRVAARTVGTVSAFSGGAPFLSFRTAADLVRVRAVDTFLRHVRNTPLRGRGQTALHLC